MVRPPLPLNVEAMAQRILAAALDLEEDANACAVNPVPAAFDDMMVSMRTMYDALVVVFSEIADR